MKNSPPFHPPIDAAINHCALDIALLSATPAESNFCFLGPADLARLQGFTITTEAPPICNSAKQRHIDAIQRLVVGGACEV